MTGKKGAIGKEWPDFYIVGAGRSGTTSLYYYLKGHPDIFMPASKEPHFFSKIDDLPPAVAERERKHNKPVKAFNNENEYLRLFAKSTAHKLIGEASTSYLGSKVAAQRIREKNPRAKIIMVLRQPIDHAYSMYLLNVREGREQNRSFYEAVRVDYEYEIKYSGGGSYYIQLGFYYQQVKRYLDIFGADQVRIFLYDDLTRDTNGLVEDICRFLEVPFYNGTFFDPSEKFHTYGVPSNSLFKWAIGSRFVRTAAASVAPMHLAIRVRDHLVDRNQPKPEPDPTAIAFLEPIFHDDILKLQELINRDLSGWLA